MSKWTEGSLDPYLTLYVKMYLKWIIDLNVEAEARIIMFAGQPSRTALQDGLVLAAGVDASTPTRGPGVGPEQGPEDSGR